MVESGETADVNNKMSYECFDLVTSMFVHCSLSIKVSFIRCLACVFTLVFIVRLARWIDHEKCEDFSVNVGKSN